MVENRTLGGRGGETFVRVRKDKQKEAVKFLLENAFTTPTKLLNPAIVNQFKYTGRGLRHHVATAAILLSSLLSASRLSRLFDAEVLLGDKAYTAGRTGGRPADGHLLGTEGGGTEDRPDAPAASAIVHRHPEERVPTRELPIWVGRSSPVAGVVEGLVTFNHDPANCAASLASRWRSSKRKSPPRRGRPRTWPRSPTSATCKPRSRRSCQKRRSDREPRTEKPRHQWFRGFFISIRLDASR